MNPADELRVKQVALELGIPFTRVTRLIRRGALKADRPGPPGSWRVRRADLDAYIANRDREAADLAQRRGARARERIGSLEQSASAICKHTAVVGFCGQCEGQWLVQASRITYAFDLDAGMVTVMPGDVDDEDGLPPYPSASPRAHSGRSWRPMGPGVPVGERWLDASKASPSVSVGP